MSHGPSQLLQGLNLTPRVMGSHWRSVSRESCVSENDWLCVERGCTGCNPGNREDFRCGRMRTGNDSGSEMDAVGGFRDGRRWTHAVWVGERHRDGRPGWPSGVAGQRHGCGGSFRGEEARGAAPRHLEGRWCLLPSRLTVLGRRVRPARSLSRRSRVSLKLGFGTTAGSQTTRPGALLWPHAQSE